MEWDYRVIIYDTDEHHCYKIHEVFYDERGEIVAVTEEAIEAMGDTLDELVADLLLMAQAAEKPVLSKRELDLKLKEDS